MRAWRRSASTMICRGLGRGKGGGGRGGVCARCADGCGVRRIWLLFCCLESVELIKSHGPLHQIVLRGYHCLVKMQIITSTKTYIIIKTRSYVHMLNFMKT